MKLVSLAVVIVLASFIGWVGPIHTDEPTPNASHALSAINHELYILNDPTGVAQSYTGYAITHNGLWPCNINPTVSEEFVYESGAKLLDVPNLTDADILYVQDQLPQPTCGPSMYATPKRTALHG